MKNKDTFGKISAILTDGLFDFIDSLLKAETTPCSLSELSQKYGQTCDELIVNQESNYGLKYVSGHFKIKLLNENEIACSADFYFKDGKDSWVVKKITGDAISIKCLIDVEIVEIRQLKEVKYVINSPGKKI